MNVSDYVSKRIKKETNIVFGITGGAVVNLFNSLDKYNPKLNKKEVKEIWELLKI